MHVSSFSIIKKKNHIYHMYEKYPEKYMLNVFCVIIVQKIIQHLLSVMNRIIIYFTKSFHFTKQQNNQNS